MTDSFRPQDKNNTQSLGVFKVHVEGEDLIQKQQPPKKIQQQTFNFSVWFTRANSGLEIMYKEIVFT